MENEPSVKHKDRVKKSVEDFFNSCFSVPVIEGGLTANSELQTAVKNVGVATILKDRVIYFRAFYPEEESLKLEDGEIYLNQISSVFFSVVETQIGYEKQISTTKINKLPEDSHLLMNPLTPDESFPLT